MLNTIVRYPHSYEKLNQIKFKPKENILVTCGSDSCFKSWALTESNLPGRNFDSYILFNDILSNFFCFF
jgi:hypothetical protein